MDNSTFIPIAGGRISDPREINRYGDFVVFRSAYRNEGGQLLGSGLFRLSLLENELIALAKTDDPAPDFDGVYGTFSEFVGNAGGDVVALVDFVNDSSGFGYRALVSFPVDGSPHLIARVGDEVAETDQPADFSGETLFTLIPIGLEPDGTVVFLGDLTPSGFPSLWTIDERFGAHSVISLLRRDPDDIGVFSGVLGGLGHIDKATMSAAGTLFIHEDILLDDSAGFENGIFTRDEIGTISRIARSDLPEPDGDGEFLSFYSIAPQVDGDLAISESGNLAFQAVLQNTDGGISDNTGLYRVSSSGLETVIRRGDQTPNVDGLFSTVGDLAVNDTGDVLFRSVVAGAPPEKDTGLYLASIHDIAEIAREGDAVLTRTGQSAQLRAILGNVMISEDSSSAFRTTITKDETSLDAIYQFDGGQLMPVFIESEPFAGVTNARFLRLGNDKGLLSDNNETVLAFNSGNDWYIGIWDRSPEASFSLVANVSGLQGNGLAISVNGAEEIMPFSNGLNPFDSQFLPGTLYSVSITSQPKNPDQFCMAEPDQGVIGQEDLIVSVLCFSKGADFGVSLVPNANVVFAGSVLELVATVENVGTQGNTYDFHLPFPEGIASVVWSCDEIDLSSCGSGSGDIVSFNALGANEFAVYTIVAGIAENTKDDLIFIADVNPGNFAQDPDLSNNSEIVTVLVGDIGDVDVLFRDGYESMLE